MLAERVPLNVILIDIDDFKQINDTFGHLTGDRVLRDIGTALHANTRAEDIVARFGGDEFIVAVPQLEPETIERIAGRLTQALEALRFEPSNTFPLGASAGIASSHLLASPTLIQLMTVADRDMYKSKWLRKHPGERPELYEYPSQDRDVLARLLSTPRAAQ